MYNIKVHYVQVTEPCSVYLPRKMEIRRSYMRSNRLYLIIYIPRYYLVLPSYRYKIMHILMHSGIPLLVPQLWTSICLYATLLTHKKCPELPDFVLIFAKIFWGRTPKPPFHYN